MSALTEQVIRDHPYSPAYGGCKCGADYENDADTYYAEWDLHATHIAEVTEQATRAQVAADVLALAHTNTMVKEHVRSGGSVDECDGYDRAIVEAANLIADGSPTFDSDTTASWTGAPQDGSSSRLQKDQ